MPRHTTNTVTVRPWPALKKGRLYKGKVGRIHINRKRKTLEVVIENLDPDQAGRLHAFALTLPLHPGNPASCFLTACGRKADAIGGEIRIDDLEGTKVAMRFSSTESEDVQFVRFDEARPPRTQILE